MFTIKTGYFIFWSGLAIIAVILYLRWFEQRTLFYPTRQIDYNPKDIGLDFEDVYFSTTDKVRLHGWWIPCKDARYSVLFFHGNAGNISHRLEKINFFHQIGCNVFIFDYRGFGKSLGRASEKGLYIDAQAAWRYLLSRGVKGEDIIGFGESLGGAVLINLAWENKKMAGLITEGTISSAKDMAKTIFPFLPHWVFVSRFNSEQKISSITIPKLIIHSQNDEIVPFWQGEKLYQTAHPPKEFLVLRGGHNSCFFESGPKIKEKVAEFIRKLGKDS